MGQQKLEKSKTPSRRRAYSSEFPEKITLAVGEEYSGLFEKAGLVQITDQESGKPKQVMQYVFRNPDTGKKESMLSTTQLDLTFDDVFRGEGGQTRLQGKRVFVLRLDDTYMSGGRNPMQHYSVSVEDSN